MSESHTSPAVREAGNDVVSPAGSSPAVPTTGADSSVSPVSEAAAREQQQHRESGTNWAEYDTNAAPQIAVDQAPEVVGSAGAGAGAGDGAAIDIEGSVQPPSIYEAKANANEKKPWYMYLLSWKLLLPIALALLIVILVPAIVVSKNNAASDASRNSGEGTDGGSSPTESSSETGGSSTSSPTSSSSPVVRCESSDMQEGPTWIGRHDMKPWDIEIIRATDAEDCCRSCYEEWSDDGGCNGWLYMPNGTEGAVPPCNLIVGEDGPNKDDDCPKGKPDIVFADGGGDENFGGAGPCGGRVRGR